MRQWHREGSCGGTSIEMLPTMVGMCVKKYLLGYEYYLIKIGYITVSGKGWSLTEKAINYLKGESKWKNKI